MSDFDKIIHDRLNEDDGDFFPRQEANWLKMSDRLASFEAANPLPPKVEAPPEIPMASIPKQVLRPVWKQLAWASAAAALVGTSGLLFWHYNDAKQENARLQQEIASLKSNKKAVAPDTVVKKEIIVQTDTIFRTTKTIANPTGISTKSDKIGTPYLTDNRAKNSVVTNNQDLSGVATSEGAKRQLDLNKNKQTAAILDTRINRNSTETLKNELSKETNVQKKNDSPLAQNTNQKVVDQTITNGKNNAATDATNDLKNNKTDVVATQTTPSVSSPVSSPVPSTIGEVNKPGGIQDATNNSLTMSKMGNNGVDRVKSETVESLTKNVTEIPKETTETTLFTRKEPVASKSDNTTDRNTSIAAKEDSIARAWSAMQEAKVDAENAAAQPPIVKTDNAWKRFQKILPKGFAIGLNGSYASELPQISGVIPKLGKGVTAELMLTQNLSVVANGDWLESHFEVQERPKHFHLPKDGPNPPKPNVELHKIDGDQKKQLLSLNAKYVLSRKWWIQPSVTVGHSWLKIDQQPVNFVFRDLGTGNETSVTTTSEAENLKNLWQVGIGLEKKIKRWTFGVSGEYQKDFSTTTDQNGKTVAANFGILRGGVKFNIF